MHNGWTLLHAASVRGHLQFAKILIKHGANIYAENKHNKAAKHYATPNVKEYLILCELSNKPDKNNKNNKNKNNKTTSSNGNSTSQKQKIEDSCLESMKYNVVSHSLYSYLRRFKDDKLIDNVCNAIISMLNDKQVISDELLMFVWHVPKQREKLWNTLQNKTIESLNFDNERKAKDYYWFKKYLLNSHIWLQPSLNNDDYFYDKVGNSIDNLLLIQKQYVKKEIENCAKSEPKFWDQILNFDEFLICDKSKNQSLRQDYVGVFLFCLFFLFFFFR